jgi:hypothetical protein
VAHTDPERAREYHREYKRRAYVKEKARLQRPWMTPAMKAGQRRRHLRDRFGLTLEGWEAKFDAQGSCCAACGTTDTGRKNWGWSTDHNHTTGALRGILCHRCNVDLHILENRSRRAILEAYLEKHK